MRLKELPLWVLLCAFSLSFAQETTSPPFGKGIFNLVGQDSSWTMKIGARMQILGVTSWEKDNDGGLVDPQTDMLIRRARLKFDGYAFTPRLNYKLELGLSNRDISGVSQFTSNTPRYILDAVVMWNFYEKFELWAGQTKLPGNIERVISSGNLQMVDRSLLNSRFNIDRDMGIQLRHETSLGNKILLRERIAISQGEGRNITTGNLGGHEYTFRLEFLPFGHFESDGEYSGADLKREESPKLMLAATYDTNQDAVKTRGNQGTYMRTDTGFYETDINTLFLDAMFKYRGFSLMAEYADRDAANPIALNEDGTTTGDAVLTGTGLNLQTGYVFPGNWEASGRFTHNDYDTDVSTLDAETQYTFGLSRYIVGHKLKVQTDLSYLDVSGGSDELMYRLQLDLHF